MIMNKVIGFVAIITICFISCTTTKSNTGKISAEEYYKNNPYAEPYLPNSHFISEDEAMVLIHAFKKHKYKVFHKKYLNNPWSTFERSVLNELITDPKTDSIFLFLAAYPKNDHSIDKEKRGHPFVILKAIPKQDPPLSGNGGSDFLSYLSQAIYLLPSNICPPPDSGCK
jgi:hypothetical protein